MIDTYTDGKHTENGHTHDYCILFLGDMFGRGPLTHTYNKKGLFLGVKTPVVVDDKDTPFVLMLPCQWDLGPMHG